MNYFDFEGHLHEDEDEDGIVQVGLSEEVKKKVLHYDSLGVKPMAIMKILRKDGVVESIGKIRNFVKRSRAKQNGPSKCSLQDLVDWANQHKKIPNDDNEPFVTAFNFSILPERDFKVLIIFFFSLAMTLAVIAGLFIISKYI